MFKLVKHATDAAIERGEDAAMIHGAALEAGFHASLLYRSLYRPGMPDHTVFFVALWGDADRNQFVGYITTLPYTNAITDTAAWSQPIAN